MISIRDETMLEVRKELVLLGAWLMILKKTEHFDRIAELVAELKNADPVPNKDLVQAVYDADCATDPTLRGGMSDALSDALGRLYRAAGLVEVGA